MKRWVGSGVAILALVGLAGYFFLHGRGRAPTALSAQSGTAAAASVGSKLPPASGGHNAADALRRRLSELPEPSPAIRAASRDSWARVRDGDRSTRWQMLPIDEVHAEIRNAAERGDLEAANLLGRRYAQCTDALERYEPEKMLTELDQLVESDAPGPYARDRLANLREQFDKNFAEYQACSSLDRGSLDQALTWLERAGRADVKGARLAYTATWAKQAGRDRDALIADIERVAAQRTLAREWLEHGLAAGEERALDLYIDAYSGQGGLFPRDPTQEMAYRYARDLVQSRRVSNFEALWASGPTRFDELTSQQWDAAQAQGRAIFKAHYQARPAWPNRSP